MNLVKKLICAIKGHSYPCPFFTNDSLCFCERCGKEVADRTFDDILSTSYETSELYDLYEETENPS